ncbi:hypothetical protein VTN77DRAFT_4047 [Rasamsonia byssochlamydoides]|uniref:uncharacterized protein n=1 Tax=Rasamsonia byssochlamydoides TaxID=89139 RepID=UPI003744AF75
MSPWSRLIRFISEEGKTSYGEPDIENIEQLESWLQDGSLYAHELLGNDPFSLAAGSRRLRVKQLLAVLTPDDVPIVRCVGLNYIKHIQEGGRTPPPYPSIFIKASTCIAGFDEDIPIPKLAQDSLDYEGELAIIIGKTGKNIPQEHALEYIAGYCSSNDISCRKWQRDPAYAGAVPQWCFSKGFDKFAPIGPVIVSPKLVGAADTLHLQTYVNGALRQDSSTSDMLFNVRDIVSFASQGTTLQKGTVIMTGTPSGVAMGMKPAPAYLKDGGRCGRGGC